VQDRTGVPKAGDPVNQQMPAQPKLDAEQRAQIHQILTRGPRTDGATANIDATIGAAVPQDTAMQDIPAEVTKIAPSYRTLKYIRISPDVLLVVEPSSHRVIDILRS
jgi:hypothetical protein